MLTPESNNIIDDLLTKVHGMIKANWRITIDGVEEELGIGHDRALKIQSPEFFFKSFLKLIKQSDKCLNVLGTYVKKNKVIYVIFNASFYVLTFIYNSGHSRQGKLTFRLILVVSRK
ncbi:hypothetical protein TNCV_2117871 [Trichonephila clavipes]|nr:hypothetical protein TNCV_2117871 [Trichonephila clavipes]